MLVLCLVFFLDGGWAVFAVLAAVMAANAAFAWALRRVSGLALRRQRAGGEG